MMKFLLWLPLACFVAFGAHAEVHPGEAQFVREVAAESRADPAQLTALLDRAHKQQSILDAIARPAEATKTWTEYRPIFLTDKRIDGGVAFYRANRALLDRIGAEYGVPPEVIVAIIGVETGYGQNTGKYRVLDALVTLAFYYPPRAKFFRGELKQLLTLGDRHLAYPIDELRGSYAGAMGWGQFMPTSVAKWAKDEDGDGRIDLWNSLPDISASVANYFREHGWQPGQPVAVRAQPLPPIEPVAVKASDPVFSVQQLEAWGYAPTARVDAALPATLLTLAGDQGSEYWLTFRNFQVITRYNKSPLYAMAVWQLAEAIRVNAGANTP